MAIQTPMYSPYQNIYNPIANQQLYPQYQQFNQQQYQQQTNGLSGRVIDDIATVTANEVAMDGSLAIFPMRDMSIIYARQWQNDGTIKTVKFKPVIEETKKNTPSDDNEPYLSFNNATKGIMEKLEDLALQIESIKGLTSRKTTKKEPENE